MAQVSSHLGDLTSVKSFYGGPSTLYDGKLCEMTACILTFLSLKSQPFHVFCAIVEFCFVSLVTAGLCAERPFIFQSLLYALWAVITICYFTNVLIDVGQTFFLLFFFSFLQRQLQWSDRLTWLITTWSIIWTEQCAQCDNNYNHVLFMWMLKLPLPWIFMKRRHILFIEDNFQMSNKI